MEETFLYYHALSRISGESQTSSKVWKKFLNRKQACSITVLMYNVWIPAVLELLRELYYYFFLFSLQFYLSILFVCMWIVFNRSQMKRSLIFGARKSNIKCQLYATPWSESFLFADFIIWWRIFFSCSFYVFYLASQKI